MLHAPSAGNLLHTTGTTLGLISQALLILLRKSLVNNTASCYPQVEYMTYQSDCIARSYDRI